jgi:hypothetical protein
MTKTDKAVEVLLEHALPRPTPPSKDEQEVRAAVQAEWQAITSKRRARTRLTRFAIAASVLLALTATFTLLRDAGIAPVQVATINKSHGSILLGNQSQLHDLSDFSAITVGQSIVTDKDAGIGLEWGGGGSLRIDANTRVEFISAEAIYLRSGRIYFDSTPSDLIASISSGSKETKFRIETDHGTVTHVGTQYMTFTSRGELTVSVREGRVSMSSSYHDEMVLEGQQLKVEGSRRASVANFPRHGAAWDWVEQTSPIADVDGRSVDEFLGWVGRETGLQIVYESPEAEQKANSGILRGKVDMDPRSALAFRMMGEDLDWHIDGGTIRVSLVDRNSGR